MAEPEQKMIDSHEERIQRLESSYPDVAADMASNTARLGGVEDKVKSVDEKMDQALTLMGNIHDSVKKQDTRVEKVEAWKLGIESAQDRRIKALKKVGLALLVAAAGGLGKTVWDLFWKALP